MRITDDRGRDPVEAVKEILRSITNKLSTNEAKKVMAVSAADTIKKHFQAIYPGSKHYSPDKVSVNGQNEVVIAVPGITRALHDLHIRPKNGKYLTIPMHREAYGISPRDMSDLFYTKNKKGTEMLAKVEGGSLSLVVMYILKESVFQKRNPNLLPTQQTIFQNIIKKLKTYMVS